MPRLSQEQVNTLVRSIPVLSLILVIGGIFHISLSKTSVSTIQSATIAPGSKNSGIVAHISIDEDAESHTESASERKNDFLQIPHNNYKKVMEISKPLMSPWGICAFSDGIIVSDRNSNSLLFFDNEGNLTASSAKNNEDKKAHLEDPVGITLWKEKVYVADSGNDRIAVFNLQGEYLFDFGKEGRGDGEFTRPVGICSDGKGSIIVVQVENSSVQIFDEKGRFTKRYDLQHTKMDMLWDVALTKSGNFVMTSALGGLTVYSHDFTPLYSLAERGSGPGSYLFTTGVTTDKDDRVIVCAKTQGKIMIIQGPSSGHKRGQTEGEIYSIGKTSSLPLAPPVIADAGTESAIQAVANYRKKIISYPMDVAVTESNLIVVAERGNGRILFFEKSARNVPSPEMK